MSNFELNYRGFKAVLNACTYNAQAIERAGSTVTELGAEVILAIHKHIDENEGRMSPEGLAIEYIDGLESAYSDGLTSNGLSLDEIGLLSIKIEASRKYCYALQSNADSLLRDDTLTLEDRADFEDTPF